MTAEEKPCGACPWVSRDERDRAAIDDPATQAAMQAGTWFCCHVNMGTCHGARIRHEQHVRREASAAAQRDASGAVVQRDACRCQIVGWSRDSGVPHIPDQPEWEQADDCPVHPLSSSMPARCDSVLLLRYGSAACDLLPEHVSMHEQLATGRNWTDERAAQSREDDDA